MGERQINASAWHLTLKSAISMPIASLMFCPQGNVCILGGGVVALLRVHSFTDGKAAIVEVTPDGTKVYSDYCLG